MLNLRGLFNNGAKGIRMVVLILMASVLLAGCSPEYNWRELPVADGRAMVAFPARVQTESRQVTLEGHVLNFSLTSASVNQNLFAVGFAPLPDTLSATQQDSIRRSLLKTLARNVGATLPESAAKGEPFTLESAAARPVRMVARVVIHRGYLFQFIATGPPADLKEQVTHEFMRSIVLR